MARARREVCGAQLVEVAPPLGQYAAKLLVVTLALRFLVGVHGVAVKYAAAAMPGRKAEPLHALPIIELAPVVDEKDGDRRLEGLGGSAGPFDAVEARRRVFFAGVPLRHVCVEGHRRHEQAQEVLAVPLEPHDRIALDDAGPILEGQGRKVVEGASRPVDPVAPSSTAAFLRGRILTFLGSSMSEQDRMPAAWSTWKGSRWPVTSTRSGK